MQGLLAHICKEVARSMKVLPVVVPTARSSITESYFWGINLREDSGLGVICLRAVPLIVKNVGCLVEKGRLRVLPLLPIALRRT
jgi:hypothetical protein